MALLGLIIPKIARWQVGSKSPTFNLFFIAAITIVGLVGMTFFWPYFGLLPVICLVSVMYFGKFFVSHYLNQITASNLRATVLSFKGLSYNLAYGLIGILYSMLLAGIKTQVTSSTGSDHSSIDAVIFVESIKWFPWYFAITFFMLLIIAKWQLYQKNNQPSENNQGGR
jgi:hypothetical protein